MKIVVANSIGVDVRGNYIIHSPSRWSEGVRNRHHWFAYYPWELSYLSSLLKKHTSHQVRLVDGCLWRLRAGPYRELIASCVPDMLIMESATRMITENVALALKIKKDLGTRLVFVGQHASAFPEELLRQGIDYVCVGEYEETVVALCRGAAPDTIAGLYPNPRRDLLSVSSLPWPEDQDVSRYAYAVPGEPSSEYREIQCYASRGCPMGCSFCVARNVYYCRANWRPRAVADIVGEIEYLFRKYPQMEGVFFDEEVHNGSTQFIVELSNALRAARLDRLHYEAMCDVRLLDEAQLAAMRRAGYYKIRIGIESVSGSVQNRMDKHIRPDAVEQKLQLAKKVGLKTYGTFMFGAPGSVAADDRGTLRWMRRLITSGLLDNLQVSVCTPQPGTPLYEQARANGWLRSCAYHEYDGAACALLELPGYPARMVLRMKNQAFRLRDHLFLREKIRRGLIGQWVRSIIRKYGWWGAVRKVLIRIRQECIYRIQTWKQSVP